tara:strand:- start:1204 stop:1425 length:222 start_codon:yes stop_codon:yes gene_type:complete
MAIITKKVEDKKEKLRVEMSSSIIEEIKEYMQWTGISDINYFLEESVTFVFSSDRDWKKYKKNSKKNQSKITK